MVDDSEDLDDDWKCVCIYLHKLAATICSS